MPKKSVKKSISLREDVFKVAEYEADRLFGGNFSAYLTYLICVDRHEKSVPDNSAVSREKIINTITQPINKENKDLDYIDSILNLK